MGFKGRWVNNEFAIHNYPLIPATIEVVMYPDPTIEERQWRSQAAWGKAVA